MARNMTPDMAAREISAEVDRDHASKIAVDQQHFIRFVEDVARELRIEPSLANLVYVAAVLDRRDIRPEVAEYPKALTVAGKAVRGADGAPVIFQDAAEEAAYHTAQEPQAPEVPQGSDPNAPSAPHSGSSDGGSGQGTAGASAPVPANPSQPTDSDNPVGRPVWAEGGSGPAGIG